MTAHERADYSRKQSPGGGPGSYPPWKPATSLTQAEAFARALGVRDVDFGGSLEIANAVNRGLSRVIQAGLSIVPKIEVTATPYVNDPRASLRLAGYREIDQALIVNPLARPWGGHGIAFEARMMYQLGFLSTDDPDHFVFHEIGHFLIHDRLSSRDYLRLGGYQWHPAELAVAAKVSGRAKTNALEFLGEVFAILMIGWPIDQDVLDLHVRLGGIKP